MDENNTAAFHGRFLGTATNNAVSSHLTQQPSSKLARRSPSLFVVQNLVSIISSLNIIFDILSGGEMTECYYSILYGTRASTGANATSYFQMSVYRCRKSALIKKVLKWYRNENMHKIMYWSRACCSHRKWPSNDHKYEKTKSRETCTTMPSVLVVNATVLSDKELT